MADPQVKVYIDWDRTGNFDGANDDVSAYWMDAQWHVGHQQAHQFVSDESRMTLLFNNKDKRFSPENTSGPYHGSIVPMTPIKLELVDSVYGTAIMWKGYIDQIQVEPGKYFGKFTTVSGIGPKKLIQDVKLNAELLVDKRSDEAIQYVLDRVLDADVYDVSYNLETGERTFSFVGDTWEGKSAYTALKDITESEYGKFFFNRDGTALFWSRLHTISLGTASVDGTVDNTAHSLVYEYADIYNRVSISYLPRVISSGTVVLWQLDTALSISEGGTELFRAAFADQTSGVSNVSGTNVVVPTGADIGWSGGSVSIPKFDRQATGVDVGVSAPITSSLETFIVRGIRLQNWNKQEYITTDQTSIDLYGERQYTINADLLSGHTAAENIANAVLETFKDPLGVVKQVSFKIPIIGTRNDELINLGMNFTIGSSLRIMDDQLDHEGSYVVVGEQHHFDQSQAGKIWNATFVVEPIGRYIVWILGTSPLGETTRLS